MKFPLVLITLVISTLTYASDLCSRLPYDLSEEGGVKNLRTSPVVQANKLTKLQRSQVWETAKRWSTENDYDGYKDLQEAIDVLRNDSEGKDLYYVVFRFEGQVYTMVESFPGGNPYGIIFVDKKVIAELHDGDVVCEK